MTGKDQLIAWLNDAYAMETQITQVLEKQADQSKDYPQIQQAIQTHLEQTKQHADLVKGAVERLGGDTSSIKSGMATVMGWMQGLSTSPAGDTLVKNGISDFGVEHFEIASYRAIIAAAQEIGDQQTVTMAQQIIPQEEWMAQFLNQNLPTVVRETLLKEVAHASS